MDPKFSIIIPIHNSDKTVASSIEAALAQDFESFEVLLVNDGSTDKTETICFICSIRNITQTKKNAILKL